MGCVTSKTDPEVVPRSNSMFAKHRSRRRGVRSRHIVSLTPSTLNSLNLDPIKSDQDRPIKDHPTAVINEKIPNTLPSTPLRDPETIDAWEMMEGLDQTSPVPPSLYPKGNFSFHPCDLPLSDLEEFYPIEDEKIQSLAENSRFKGEYGNGFDLKKKKKERVVSDLEESYPIEDEKIQSFAENVKLKEENGNGFDSKKKKKERVVMYFTSLRGVRKTYEDCCSVKAILKGYGIRIDERDISMHSDFKEELKELLGEEYIRKRLGLPKIFLGKIYIGGADEIRKLHEDHTLEKTLEGCEIDDSRGGICEACGDVRFVPCDACSGSCKIYYEDDYNDDEECGEGDIGFRRCPDCNENGLIRCPICFQ